MLTQEDIKNLTLYQKEIFATKQELNDMEQRLGAKIDVLTMAVDSFSKEIADFRAQAPVIRKQLRDHDEYLELLADKVGIKLPR